MNISKIINVVQSLSGGNSKAVEAAKQAISESKNFSPDLAGAVKIAEKFGFDAASVASMRQYLNNPIVKTGLGLLAPEGTIQNLEALGNQLETKLKSGSGGHTALPPAMPAPQKGGLPSDPALSSDNLGSAIERLSRLKF